jgi:hypothetical protein
MRDTKRHFRIFGAVAVAEQKNGRIPQQHAEHRQCKHAVHVDVAEACDDAAGNQGDVLGQRQAGAADHQRNEYGNVAVLGKNRDQSFEQIHACRGDADK